MSVRHRWRRRFATFFLLSGIAGVSIWAWSVGHEAVYQDWSNWTFDRRASGESASVKDYMRYKWGEITDRPKPAPVSQAQVVSPASPEIRVAEGDPVGRLSIPALGVRAIVREGTETGILGVALGHIAGTAMPGRPGNTAVAGHRDTLFRGLRNIKRGMRIEFETPERLKYVYEVENISVVSPSQVSVLKAGLYPQLTLVTCYPFDYVGSAPYRFIVKARQLGNQVNKAPEPMLISETQAPRVKRIVKRPALRPMPYDDALVYSSTGQRPGY